MFCPRCGKEYSSSVNFCCQCGAAMYTPVQADKKLMRSRSNSKIAGVCGGLGDYLGVDPTLIRLVWLLLVFFAGTGILAYIIAWIVMPEEPLGEPSKTVAPASTPAPASNPQPAPNN
jgi:phage shock protein C